MEIVRDFAITSAGTSPAVSDVMRHALLSVRPALLGLSLALSLSAVACAANTDEDAADGDVSEEALASGTGFDVNAAKAQGRKVTDHGKGDTCVALKPLPGATYKEEDLKKEDKLCNADFYIDQKQGDEKPVVLCPKLNSTNPGTNVYELADGQSKSALQSDASCLSGQDKLEKIGKYKQSLWCGHTGAVLAAYHVSRALGDVAGVPAAVLRTMDKASHRTIVDQGARLTTQKYGASSKTFIKRNWNALWPCLHDGRSDCGLPGTPSENLYIRGPVLWDTEVATTSFKSGHLVGAFMANASEDGTYPNITTSASVKTNKRYVALKGGALSFAKGYEQETVQGILAMKDISDFLILDTIIEQQDRFSDSGGNLSQKKYLVWQGADGVMHSERADKKKDAPDTALTIARMVIEDNDCGLRKGMRRARGYDELIAGIRHLAPSTYTGLMNLAANIDAQRAEFTQGMAMSNKEFDRLAENVHFVADTFSSKCSAGQLTLDLDVDGYIKGNIPSCK